MTLLSPEHYRQLKEDVVFSARRANIARKVMAIRGPLGLGMQEFSYDKLSEVADAIISHVFEARGYDVPEVTRSTLAVPVLQKMFTMSRRDVESARRYGTALNSALASSGAYKVACAENTLALLGWSRDGSTYDINGLYNGAGNTITGSDFGTAGNAISTVADAMGELMADEIFPPYNLLVHPTQYAELAGSVLTNGDREVSHVKEVIGGSLIPTPFITDGTAMLLASPEARHFELVVAQDLTVETWEDAETGDLRGRVFECVVPAIYDANAICAITGV